jgi:MSHA pilin protein MshC
MRNSSGFTMLEIIVVLILMGIIAAYVMGRSLGTDDLDLTSQTDKIRGHIRYAQAEALKRSDKVWGIKFESGQYWLFRGTTPDNAGDQVKLPGVDYADGSSKVSLPTGVSLTATIPTLFFNRIGKPYSAYADYDDDTKNTALASAATVTVTSGGQSRTISITPETGLVR